MVIRKGHHPEGLGSGHREGEDKEVVIVVLTGAPNLLLEALTLNGGYSHHLSSHTLSSIGNSSRLGTLRVGYSSQSSPTASASYEERVVVVTD